LRRLAKGSPTAHEDKQAKNELFHCSVTRCDGINKDEPLRLKIGHLNLIWKQIYLTQKKPRMVGA
jgi:hypothetical protein